MKPPSPQIAITRRPGCTRRAAIAEGSGVEIFGGCFLESSIGTAANLQLGAALPAISESVILDATSQTTNMGDTNPGFMGAGGTVGVDALPLSQVQRPEIEIVNGASIANGLQISADTVTIRGFAVHGFDTADIDTATVRFGPARGAIAPGSIPVLRQTKGRRTGATSAMFSRTRSYFLT